MQQRVAQSMKRPTSVANRLMSSRLRSRPEGHFETTEDRIAGLDREQVNAEIRQTFPLLEEFLNVVVTPDADAMDGACVITEIEEWKQCFEAEPT